MVEQKTQERLTNYDPTPKELLEMFVVAAGGSFPFAVSVFSEGLQAASEKFSPLKVFIDREAINHLSSRFDEGFKGASLSLVNDVNSRWEIPSSDPRRNKIEAKMTMMLTSQGKQALEEATKAAKKVWKERAI